VGVVGEKDGAEYFFAAIRHFVQELEPGVGDLFSELVEVFGDAGALWVSEQGSDFGVQSREGRIRAGLRVKVGTDTDPMVGI